MGGYSSSAGSGSTGEAFVHLAGVQCVQAANGEKDQQARIKALDDFVAKYPMAESRSLCSSFTRTITRTTSP